MFGINHELVEYQVKCLKEFSRASAAMFKLPQLNEDCERTDLGYVPTLSVIDNILVQYIGLIWTLMKF